MEGKSPSKILYFGWRFLHKRVATKDHFFKRGILKEHNDLLCVMCMMEVESLSHLFGDCEVTSRICNKVFG